MQFATEMFQLPGERGGGRCDPSGMPWDDGPDSSGGDGGGDSGGCLAAFITALIVGLIVLVVYLVKK